MSIRTLQARLAKITGDMRGMLDKAAAESRDLSAEESTAYDALKASAESTRVSITREQEVAAAEAALPAVESAAGNGLPSIEMGVDRKTLDKKAGFKTMGEFARSVYNASVKGRLDPRLRFEAAAPTTFGNEGAGGDGGFVIPPAFSQEIFTLALTDDALLPLTDGVPVSGNSMVFPKDETTPWGTNGVRAYWQAEATAGTQTKPLLSTTMLRLHKMMALVPMTDELLEDAPAMGSYLSPLMARSIRWKTNEALLFGTGAGQPLGMFTNAGTTGYPSVVQAKDSGQATSTLTIGNITNMVARLVAGSGPAFWFITPDALPSLYQMTLGNYPIYLPINQGLQANVNAGSAFGGTPEGMLLGRPLYKSQHAAAFSAQGDLLLIAPEWYRTITKAGEGIEVDQSLHLYFDADAVAFRALFRLDGQPKIVNPITQAKGSKTLSPFVTLAAR